MKNCDFCGIKIKEGVITPLEIIKKFVRDGNKNPFLYDPEKYKKVKSLYEFSQDQLDEMFQIGWGKAILNTENGDWLLCDYCNDEFFKKEVKK